MPSLFLRIRVPVVVLAFSVLASSLVIDAAASEKPAEPAKGAPAAKAGNVPVGEEILDQRTRTSKTFKSADGRGSVTQLFAGPVHFKASNGDWLEMQNNLERRGGKLRNARNSYSLELPERLGAGHAVKVAEGGDWLTFELAGAAGAPAAADGTAATFADTLPGVDVRYSAQPSAVKEDIVLAGPDSPTTVRYQIAGSDGLTGRETRDGAIEFKNAGGEVAFVLPAPFMYDASGETSSKVSYALDQAAGGWTLTVRADRDWLAAKDRKWPITVDPSVYFYASDRDCTLDQSAPTTNQCNDTVVRAGKNGSVDKRAVLDFDVAGNIPKDAVVNSARMTLYESSNTHGVTKKIGAYKVTQAWQEGATWNTTNGTTAWTTAGGTHNTALLAETEVGSTAGWESWYVTKQVRKWVDGTDPDYGLLLKDSVASPINNEVRFNSSENSNVGSRPSLLIDWWPRGGNRNDATYAGESLNDRMGYQVNVGNGNLALQAEDVKLAGTGLDLVFNRYYNSLWALNYGGQFGGGITSNLGKDVWLNTSGWPEENKTAFLGDGSEYSFDKNGSGWDQPAGLNADLTENAGTGNMELKYRGSELNYIFDNGGLTELTDRNGNHLDFNYDVNGNLDSIVDTKGQTLDATVNGDGFITQLQDVSGRQWKYAYGTGLEWNLVKTYTDPENKVTSYDWDGATNLLLKITSPGGRQTKFEYFSDRRIKKIIRVDNPGAGTGPTTQFAYATGGTPCQSTETRTVVTDPRSNTTTYCSDPTNNRVSKVRDQKGNDTDSTYNPFGNVEQITAPGSAVTNPEDNPRNLPESSTAPESEVGTNTYGDATWTDLVSQFTNEQGTAFAFTFDGSGNVATSTQGSSPTNVEATAHRDIGKGLITRIVDGNSNTTTYTYDPTKLNLVKIEPPATIDKPAGQTVNLGKIEFAYDGVNRIDKVYDGLHPSTGTAARDFDYDKLDRLKKVLFADGKCIEYVYDDDGNRTSRTEGSSCGAPTSTTSYTFDKLNRLTQQTLPGGATNTMTYDANGNMATFQDSGGTTTYGYDAANLLEKLAEPGGSCTTPVSLCTTFTNTARGQRDVTTYPGGAAVDYDYDKSDKPTVITAKNSGGTAVQKFTYDYVDPALTSRKTTLLQNMVDLANNKTTYDYENPNTSSALPGPDRLRRALTKTSGGTGSLVDDYRYLYDKNSNLIERKIQIGAGSLQTTTFKYNQANQLCWKYNGTSSNGCSSTPAGGETYRYDQNGNQTIGTGGRTYTYNHKDQTSQINSTALTYIGAGQNELTGIGSTSYQNSPLGIGIHTTAGTPSYYVRDPDGTPISVKTSGTRHYFVQDQLGSVTGLINSSSSLAATYRYEPYGKLASTTGSVTNQLKFAGGHDTGLGIYHFGARYYDPEIARWSQIDPIDQAGDLREGNKYAYAGSDPVNWSDPQGEKCGCGGLRIWTPWRPPRGGSNTSAPPGTGRGLGRSAGPKVRARKTPSGYEIQRSGSQAGTEVKGRGREAIEQAVADQAIHSGVRFGSDLIGGSF